LTVDLDVNAIGAHSESTRAQIVDVLTAVDSEVGAVVGGTSVNRLINFSGRTPGSSSHSDSCWWQRARGNTVQGQSETHRNNSASNIEDTRSICIDRLLNLRSIAWSRRSGRCGRWRRCWSG